MLLKLVFERVRALADVSVSLRPLTLLVGPNGAGKSTVLDGAHALTRAIGTRGIRQRLDRIFAGRWHPDRIRTAGASGDIVLTGTWRAGDETHELTTVVDAASGTAKLLLDRQEVGELGTGIAFPRQLSWLGSALRLRLEASRLAEESYSAEEIPRIEHDGYGLATVLAWVAQTDRDLMPRLEEQIRCIVPRVRRIRTQRKRINLEEADVVRVDDQAIRRTRPRQVAGDRLEVELEGAGWVPADLLSEGTLICLGILTILNMPERPKLLLLDDIERGLHPRGQRELARLVTDIVATTGTQIVATTHSPFVLDGVDPSGVRVLQIDAQGHTRCRELQEHPDWAKWKDVMKPGELWSWAGESWVFQHDE